DADRVLYGEQLNVAETVDGVYYNLYFLCGPKIKTSWTVLNYFVTLSQTQNKIKERTKWQPKKGVRSPEARAKVVEKRERRARQNPVRAEAQRSQLRQPRSPRRKLEPGRVRRKRLRSRRRRPQRR